MISKKVWEQNFELLIFFSESGHFCLEMRILPEKWPKIANFMKKNEKFKILLPYFFRYHGSVNLGLIMPFSRNCERDPNRAI